MKVKKSPGVKWRCLFSHNKRVSLGRPELYTYITCHESMNGYDTIQCHFGARFFCSMPLFSRVLFVVRLYVLSRLKWHLPIGRQNTCTIASNYWRDKQTSSGGNPGLHLLLCGCVGDLNPLFHPCESGYDVTKRYKKQKPTDSSCPNLRGQFWINSLYQNSSESSIKEISTKETRLKLQTFANNQP